MLRVFTKWINSHRYRNNTEKLPEEYLEILSDYDELLDDEKRFYSTYAIGYKEELDDSRQKFIYLSLKKESSVADRIQVLINLTKDEIDKQFERKSNIENRCGFILALWGIIIGILLNTDYGTILNEIQDAGNTLWASYLKWMLRIIATIMILAIIAIIRTLWSDKLSRFRVEDVNENYITAVRDGNLMYTVMLEYYTKVWTDNEKIINKKGKSQNAALILVIAASVLTAAATIIKVT